MIDLRVDWKESLLILLGVVLIILLYYVFNRKSIKIDNEREKLLKERMQQPRSTVVNEEDRKCTTLTIQAYERLIILMERIDLHKLVVRVDHISELKHDYATFLIQNIEQEFDFNSSQQLYVSE